MKLTRGLITTIIFAVMAGLWLFKATGQTDAEPTKTTYSAGEAEKFVNRLDELGYFKYADSSDLDTLKRTFINEFDPEGELVSVWDDNTSLPKDYRYYFCDGETIFEEGGITGLLKDLKPVFNKMQFTCDISNHYEEWNPKKKWLNHQITINGTEYIIFKNFKDFGWGEAPFRIAQILNIELKKQNKDEQIYLVNGGNDGRLALLTNDQYHFIYSTYQDKKWKPLEINEWAKEFSVKPMKLDQKTGK